ncbi:hypothetical protein JCM19232_2633 [Vibrio ishigakensis]|uniref:Uncharacterized protein n=1 Tax=Vibrio ishigakensis TaxID=1481914 RepID=A0A0B8PKL2_9VIBR|nr:hypothetical protein JCM19232_2633 [Vibrio ishigakensis]
MEFISFALGKVAPSAAAVLDSLPMTLRRRHPDLTPSQLETINRELAKCMNEIASLGENLDEVLDEYQRITEK